VLIYAVQAQALKWPWGRGGLDSTNVFHKFPVAQRKCSPKFHVLLHASHAALPNLNLKNCSLLKKISKDFFLQFHFPKFFPPLKDIFTSRMSVGCLGIFKGGHNFLPPLSLKTSNYEYDFMA
jgi:hypothetical protein